MEKVDLAQVPLVGVIPSHDWIQTNRYTIPGP